jgi:hypothetical protein
MSTTRTTHEQEAFDRGVEDAVAAASWIIDGNTPQDAIRRTLELIDAGDDMSDYQPRRPDLSGEYADDLTPNRLADDIFGHGWCPDFYAPEGEDHDRMMALCDAYEAGVDETFDVECERILRAALEPCRDGSCVSCRAGETYHH